MKKFSVLLIIREMQIKTTMRFHIIPVRMAIIKTLLLQTTNSGDSVEKREPSYNTGVYVSWYTTMKNRMEVPQKK